MVCSVIGCKLEDGCGNFLNNFAHVPDVLKERDGRNETVFVSFGQHASITLGVGDADMVECDARCFCQPWNSDHGGSCQRPPSTAAPSLTPTASSVPSMRPSDKPIISPTTVPSYSPTATPSYSPSTAPSSTPSHFPSKFPTASPTINFPLVQLLRDKVYGDKIDKILKDDSPQGTALRWMAHNDKIVYDPVDESSRWLQRYGLVALDFSFHNSDPSKLNWTDASLDECSWSGIYCAYFDGIPYVRSINWARRGLKGRALPEFSLFPAIETLDLAQNSIQGTLDPFYDLQFLKNLYLFENKFSGPIKDDIDKLFRLESLYLGHNSLTGSLPSGLWDEAKVRPLQWLVLHHNNLNGTFPLGMRLSRLRYCDLSSNEFEGTIPSDWPTLLMNMRTLYLNDNQITGSIPQNFSEIGSGWLKQIDFSSNKLTGRFPQWGNPIYYLTNIDIRDNQFTRDMPSSICSMSVFDRAEMVELRADCDICDCGKKLCDNCR